MTSNSLPENCFIGAVTVGERGQVVIPAEARRKLGINTGDRLLVITHPGGEGLMMFTVSAMREFLVHLSANLNLVEGSVAGQDDAVDECSELESDSESEG